MNTEYSIIRRGSPDLLERAVNDLLSKGWVISPGFAIAIDETIDWWCQPMTLSTPDNGKPGEKS